MRPLPLLLALGLAGPLHAAIVIDGSFSDWTSVASTATDSTGDAPSANVDLTDFKVDFDSATLPTTIYLYYQVAGTNDFLSTPAFYNILIDTDASDSTGFTFDGTSAGGFDVLLQGGATNDYAGTGGAWGWTNFVWRGPFATGGEYEVAIPLADLGVGPGDPLDFVLFTDSLTRDYMPDDITVSSIGVTVVPEPTTSVLLLVLGMFAFRRRR